MFTIECAFSVMCPVRATFKWSKDKERFLRQGHPQIYHDHCVQLRHFDLDQEVKSNIEARIRELKKDVKGSQISEEFGLPACDAT
jgi:hypothetical protein